ncbi:isoleucine--tRNA ligase [Mycobacterium koreense]|uniref:Isoleucine--tRNA ligase n=1 Tax=Mycolicibacillus koreensis TaxID=1069220 RepID=A0A7I7SAH7_9MYCO|nr:isoleucine--tRNA ligase [Mycolicibacillus koreensis]MCV7248886.1 isoleucine--tRNA ligase [Mycolicibacillus koreensis]ODR09189.1 isoleucine--tRNA ligase [Mycolicibacillus koreensis]OSC36009.1 isoleucine--tRNA ligase [Mycolicibacillus koreensis]BBY53733.1 isoleucine--tRNA ligase [Mycolicibacillus koreensis]
MRTDQAGGAGYPKLSGGSPDFPTLETEVLDYWAADDTFRASIARRADAEEYVFYDGPPFANGLPHYGHLLTGYVKDIVPRYRTMRGYKVERRFGWDTHGLPAELEVERQLGITDKSQIDTMGIAAFNAACRESVLRYTDEWRAYVTRQARWVDFDNDYKTLDPTFMESVIWAFKQLYDKGLAYQGYRVLPYCWRDETPLSNHELRMDDDVYQSRQDPALTVGFRLADDPAAGELAGAHLLVWTTTPWTLPSNQAVAVGPQIDYVQVAVGEHRYVLAAERLGAYARELGEEPEVLARLRGADLIGLRYLPPFPFFADTRPSFTVLGADFVSTEDGTGLVHLAPAYGEDDKATTDPAGITPVTPVDARGRFDDTVPAYAGQHVFDANKAIIADLKNGTGPAAEGGAVLVRHETYEHPYPHCWRCRNPLIYKAVSSWFIKVTEFKDRMVELNESITWHPDHVKHGQFGKWLAGARDWSISRNRYWGTPIPVWVSDDPAHPRVDVYGSLDELEADFGVRPDNLHRPYIDELTRPNPDDPSGRAVMRRIPDVLDVWFDSGSMPFAQVHYPFENADWFDGGGPRSAEAHFPGDFIVEYIGQTRGWFYTLHVLATALFDRPAFKTCVAHGIVLGSDGQKMSKSLRNYPDVSEVFDRDGSDAMRWFLMSSPILRGGNLVVTEAGIREGVRQVMLPLANAYSFLALYAPRPGRWRTDSTHVLDRYILAKLAALRDELTARLDECDISGACERLRNFTDALTNWYVRRSRSRFWTEDADAIDTLHTVLEVTARLAAPLLPLTTEVIWRGLTGQRSVHLTDWPSALPGDLALVAAMDQVRDVCSTASSLRKAKKLRVRLPLPKLTVAVDDPSSLEPFVGLIADELNIKTVELTDDIAGYGRFELTVNARVAGPRLGRDVQAAIKAVKAGEAVLADDGTLHAGPAVLQPGEFETRLVAADPEFTAALPAGTGLVVLDATVTPELEAEGWAKDRIRELQDLRKSTGLEVSDRITVVMAVPQARAQTAATHRDLIAGEILATEFTFADPGPDAVEIGDGVRVAIRRA